MDKLDNVNEVKSNWYVLCHSDFMKKNVLHKFEVLNQAIVAYRNSANEIIALPDRCPHRNAPLSSGQIKNDNVVCPYHGWNINKYGECVHIPGMKEQSCLKTFLKPFLIHEESQIVFINLNNQVETSPHIPTHILSKELSTFYYQIDMNCNYIDLVENFLDPFHTPILHPGLIRTDHKRSTNLVTMKRIENGLEFHYKKEKKQSGTFSSFGPDIKKGLGRFRLPSTVELEFFSEERLEYTNTMFLTPLAEFKTRAHFFVSITNKFPYPAIFRLIGAPILKRVVKQDKVILEKLTRNILQFGGAKFTYASSDFARRNIEKLIENKDAHLEFKEQNVLL